MSESGSTPRRRERVASPCNLQGWKILIVDDQEDNLKVAEAALRYCGAELFTAVNGIKGLEIVQQHNDLKVVLLDLSMPDMNGWVMFEKLRENPVTVHLPVIALTAHAMEGDREKVMKAGFTGYISKPFSIVTLGTEVAAILRSVNSGDHAE